jgi:trehalose 6-phosphate phosphatase
LDRTECIDLLCADPGVTGIVSDFDGTLSDIVDDPRDAAPVEGAVAALTALARMFRTVAIVSGRSLEDLGSRFAPRGVALLGSYGRERSDRRGPRPRPGGWEPVAIAAAARTRELDGVVVERKGTGVALHYRRVPQRAGDVLELAQELAGAFGLDVLPGRLVAELVAPGPRKGEALQQLVLDDGLERVLYAGDDVADIDAFERARSLVPAVLVAVRSEESPAGFADMADVVVSAPAELVDFLRDIARRATAPT